MPENITKTKQASSTWFTNKYSKSWYKKGNGHCPYITTSVQVAALHKKFYLISILKEIAQECFFHVENSIELTHEKLYHYNAIMFTHTFKK